MLLLGLWKGNQQRNTPEPRWHAEPRPPPSSPSMPEKNCKKHIINIKLIKIKARS